MVRLRISVAVVVFLAALVFSAVLPVSSLNAETWTALEGDRSIEAKLIGLWNDNVVLDMGDGRRVSVPMIALRSDSRIQAQELWREIQRSRQSRVAELQGQAEAAAAPAPNPIPQPPAPEPYQPPLAGGSVTAYLQHIDSQLAAGHPIVIFDSLPPSYRGDLSELVKLAAAKINPAAWQTVTGGLNQLGDLLVTRQNWFFSNPRIKALPSDQLESLQQRLLAISGLLRTGFNRESMELTTLQSANFAQWLAERDQEIAPYFASIMQLPDSTAARSFSVVSESADKAVVEMVQSEQKKQVTFLNVDGYWVPETTAKTWDEDVASLKQQLEEAPAGSFLAELGVAAMGLRAKLDPLANSSDKNQFHSAMETAMTEDQQMFTALAPYLSQVGITLANNDPRNRRGGYDPDAGYEDYGDGGYDDDYDEQMRAEMEQQNRGGSGNAGSGRGSGSSRPPRGR